MYSSATHFLLPAVGELQACSVYFQTGGVGGGVGGDDSEHPSMADKWPAPAALLTSLALRALFVKVLIPQWVTTCSQSATKQKLHCLLFFIYFFGLFDCFRFSLIKDHL